MPAMPAPARDDDDPYAAIAEWYDHEHDDFQDDIALYTDLAAGAGPEVLEIGCGSGRVTLPLVEAGSRVTAVDASAAMLARCRARLAVVPPKVARRVTLVRGDARALGADVPTTHALAIIPLNTFAHFALPADRRRALEQVRAHVVPGGRLVLDVDLDGPRRLLAQPGLLWLVGTWEPAAPDAAPAAPDATTRVSHFVSATTGAEPDTIAVTHLYDAQDARGFLRRTVTTMTQSMLTHQELLLTLEQARFAIEGVYGSYELEPYRAGAERVIVVARTL
ncbi:MAG TPA: class I SAM-dependent methyltransferase [Ktedonobacterales bacterium]|jgi:SAM-dependent methyltransferase